MTLTGVGRDEADVAVVARCAASGVSVLRQKDDTPFLPLPEHTVISEKRLSPLPFEQVILCSSLRVCAETGAGSDPPPSLGWTARRRTASAAPLAALGVAPRTRLRRE